MGLLSIDELKTLVEQSLGICVSIYIPAMKYGTQTRQNPNIYLRLYPANMIRKVSRRLGLELNRLSRGVLTRPQRINLWSARGSVERRSFKPSRNIRLESPVLQPGE
jgi:hypothetical protein